MLAYALGRQLEYYDEPALRKILAALEADDYRFQTLVKEIVASDPFSTRSSSRCADMVTYRHSMNSSLHRAPVVAAWSICEERPYINGLSP